MVSLAPLDKQLAIENALIGWNLTRTVGHLLLSPLRQQWHEVAHFFEDSAHGFAEILVFLGLKVLIKRMKQLPGRLVELLSS